MRKFSIIMFQYLFLIAFLSLMLKKCNGFLKCDSDADCQDGYSCIEKTCKICVKCSWIFRRGNNCESDFNDCGDCLEGYKEILVTDNSAVKKPCKPIKKIGNLKECATDDNCPPDNYCSKKSCVNCFDCNLINRLKPEKCAIDPYECGPCFIGYLSTNTKSRTNYNKCIKAPPDLMPYNISSGSALIACAIGMVLGIVPLVIYTIRCIKGLESSKTIHHSADGLSYYPSAPPANLMDEGQTTKIYNENDCVDVRCETQEIQQAKVYKWPSASYYPVCDVGRYEISEPDSGPSETSNVSDQTASAQREETISSQGSGICGERASRSLSEVNSINSGSDSQGEQSVDVNALNDESAGNNSHLVADNPAEVPENPGQKQPAEDVPLNHG